MVGRMAEPLPPPKLPPLAAVRVFEAAARHQNFTRAAEELGMTQAAVSYQIRLLEDRVGAALFLRQPRQVVLTPLGQRLAGRCSRDAGWRAPSCQRRPVLTLQGQTPGPLAPQQPTRVQPEQLAAVARQQVSVDADGLRWLRGEQRQAFT